MTQVVFFTDNDLITGFNIKNHSGYGEEGEDIVCSAISSASYMTVNTVTDVLKLKPKVLFADDAEMELQLNSKDAMEASTLLEGFKLHITELSKEYEDYIKVKIRR
jgi:uncharacterized protein YsxB (DUF464 family)